jgi:predicted RNA polymerase sigma factor
MIVLRHTERNDCDEAALACRRALELAENGAERAYLERRLSEVSAGAWPGMGERRDS